MVDVKKDMNMSAEKAIEKRILELNASTENRIKDISETLSVRLNESTENRLQDVFQEQSKMSDKVKTVQDEFQQHKQVTEQAVAEGERQLKEDIRNISSDLNKTLDRVYNETSKKFAEAEEKRELVYSVIKHLNFMRADSWGMLVILMGAMEVILYFYICIFLNNRRPRSTDARPSVPVAPPARVDTGDNDTLCIVYFVERDLRQLRRWMNEIIEETRAIQRMRTMNYVIASRDDIRDIPTCRLALVFVNPDERQLILEDDFHMGSTRRDTVQALHHRGAEVILIVYGDPTSRIRVLQDGSLFDPSLTQVTSHPVLKDLNSRNRILSVKESFSAHQKRHLVATIDQIFA
ncbi:uncharacterized protein LOC112554891 [Pomacea canaliculata]|uniref:uncharacterized protein LOC112554891 n=1 Tax=Pomacea canaliculata TaxID=400727 RepID=UPI000D73C048|nr:uncharacterized protein LOC112554891 [Pomacea canaliculata]